MLLFLIDQKQRRQKNKERDKKGEPQESKKERQEGRKKRTTRKRERERERDRERRIEQVGGQKKLRRNEGRHSKINKNASFQGKNIFLMRSKERNQKKNKNKTNKTNKTNKQKTNKEGLGPSEVALRVTSPDP